MDETTYVMLMFLFDFALEVWFSIENSILIISTHKELKEIHRLSIHPISVSLYRNIDFQCNQAYRSCCEKIQSSVGVFKLKRSLRRLV